MTDQNRTFKGIWIPAPIWLSKKINIIEKCLLAEIDSFSNTEQGCIAKNKYFCDFFGIKEDSIRKYITHLKQLGLVELVHFDGKTRELKSNLSNLDSPDPEKIPGQTRKKFRDRPGKNSGPIIYNNIYNKKDNNIDLPDDSGESSSDKVSEETLKSFKSPKVKKQSAIEKDLEFKEILKMWNRFPLASKHARLDTKTVIDAHNWFNRLKDGTYCRHASFITAGWLKEIGAPIDWQTKRFTFEEIKEGVRRLGLQYEEGYWPYTIEEKKRFLPKSLAASFYSPYNRACPSPFLKVLIKEPMGQGVMGEDEKGRFEEYFAIYEKYIGIREKDRLKVAKYIKAILYNQKCACETMIKAEGTKMARCMVEEDLGTNFINVVGDTMHNKVFVEQHAMFLEECSREWQDFKITSTAFSPHGKMWEKFIEWLDSKYKVKLWLSSDEEEYLALRHSNYLKERNKKPIKKDTRERIKELKQIIKREKSEDVRMLFEEELNKLREDLKKEQAV